MFLIHAFVVAALVDLNLGYAVNKCDAEGEKYWCQNYDTAVQCGVVAFCNLKYPDFKKQKITFTPIEKVEEDKAAPVKVELYYESFCPGCRSFLTTQLFPAFQKVFSTGILDIGLYPYGNAYERQVDGKWVFTCQHGEEECQVNKLEACALHMLLHPSQFMPFINCVESEPGLANAELCAKKLKIEWGPISNCYNGSQGNHLVHEIALKTNALIPPHTYVPWIVVDGQHTDAIQESCQSDLLHYVCKTYKGVQPHACRVAAMTENRSASRKLPETLCYKN